MQHILHDELTRQVEAILAGHGLAPEAAAIIAGRIVAAQRDGALSHGLFRLPGYCAALKSGWVDGAAVPELTDRGGGVILADAGNGFAQPALEMARQTLADRARTLGMAMLAIRNSHHFAALWPDVEPFARDGLIAMAFVNTRNRMLAWDSKRKVLGTSPLAFACPRAEGPPIVVDQASSTVALGEILMAAEEGRQVPPGSGVDAQGRPTTDPGAILAGGALTPFGGYKGASIAFMVEVMAAALTGGQFGFEHDETGYAAAPTTRAGQCVIVIDPDATVGRQAFLSRVERFLAEISAAGNSRLPGSSRHERRERAERDGIALSDAEQEMLRRLSARARNG